MKNLAITLLFISGSILAASESFAHMYDSVGVEAGPHAHGPSKSDIPIKDNCFIDPKLGPICK